MAKDDVKEKVQVETQEKQEKDAPGINPKWLEGLVFKGATMEEVEDDGRKKKKFIPFKRPLTPDDVISFKDYGVTVVITTKDGKKYTVKKVK